MRTRTYDPSNIQDWNNLTSFLLETGGKKDVDLYGDFDRIVLVEGSAQNITGMIAGRPMCLLHEFRIHPYITTNRRHVAESLWNYSMGAAVAAGHSEAILLIDKSNLPMIRFAREHGAVEQTDPTDSLFTLKLL